MLYILPRLSVDNRLMQAVVDLPFMTQPSDIDRVRQDPVEMTARDRNAAGLSAGCARPNGRANVNSPARNDAFAGVISPVGDQRRTPSP
jgi:hypothetical protein